MRVLSPLLRFAQRRTRFLQPAFMKLGQGKKPGPGLPTRPLAVDRLPLKHNLPTSPPLISIVVPSFNQGGYLEQALQSILDQDYPRLELVVVDGGSTDDSVQIIHRYADRLSWWCSEPDSGQGQALNKGFSYISGDVLAWLNSDDLLLPGTLARVASYFDAHAGVDLVYGQRILIDDQRHEIGRWILPPHNDRILSWIDLIPQETMFWRQTLWKRCGRSIDESFSFAMDWELLLRFREAGARMVRLPCFMGAFRVHASQKTSSEIHDLGFREMQRLRTKYLGFAPAPEDIALHTVLYALRVRVMELMWQAGALRYG